MSGRTPVELDQLFKRVPNVGLIAENGCFFREAGGHEWTTKAEVEHMQSWKESVEGIMNYYVERTPGSSIETRNCSLIFHYKNAEDYEAASRQAGDCASHINDACEGQRVRAIPIEGAVAVEPTDFTKATAAESIVDNLKTRFNSSTSPMDFLMVAGDGREDELIFRWANELSKSGEVKNVTTVTLGSRNTEAMCTLTQGVTGQSVFQLTCYY